MESSSSAAPKELNFVRDVNGYRVVLRGNRLCSVEVQLYGAQVLSWKNHYGQELLFVSKADSNRPKPVAGGIQICFPTLHPLIQRGLPVIFFRVLSNDNYSNYGNYPNFRRCLVLIPNFRGAEVPNHGYRDLHELARYRLWKIDESPPPLPTCSLTRTFVDLILRPSEDDLRLWPHRFEYRLRVALGHRGDLIMISRIKNMDIIGGKNFSFAFAYRNYLRVPQINEVRIEGLGRFKYYINNVEEEDHKFLDQADTIRIQSELDKVFLKTPSKICVMDQQKRQAVVIRKEGLPDLGVWNPWKTNQLQDEVEEDEYEKMVCVEPGAVEHAITLRPAQEWRVIQELSFVPSTFFK